MARFCPFGKAKWGEITRLVLDSPWFYGFATAAFQLFPGGDGGFAEFLYRSAFTRLPKLVFYRISLKVINDFYFFTTK